MSLTRSAQKPSLAPIAGSDETTPGYRERSLWASLGAVALVDTVYFFMVVKSWLADNPLDAQGLIRLSVGIVVLLLVIEAVFLLANRARHELMDERDQLIAAQSARLAYAVFVVGVLCTLALYLLNAAGQPEPLWGLELFAIPHFEVHLILAALVSAELTRYGTSLLRYRRGY